MKNLENYLKELQSIFPDIRKRLNAGAKEEEILQLETAAGCALPADFVELYRTFDGTDLSRETGFFAGLEFLPVKSVLLELDFFRRAEDELTAMGTRAIQEAPMCELCWIPFAFDGSRAFLVLDLSPAKSGKSGQIITVDYDFDQTYLLADGMDDFFGIMTGWLREGVLTVDAADEEEAFLMEASGHLFNSLEKLTEPAGEGSSVEISLPAGFWQKHYMCQAVAKSVLAKEKIMRLSNETVDCTLFGQMENLKELILHDCELVNFGSIAKAGQLKKLIMARCTFSGEGLMALAAAPALKELGLNVMDAFGLQKLSVIKTLKSLQVREVTGIKPEELAAFTGLWELRIERMGLHDGCFLTALKHLKKLDLCWHVLDDLDFLKALPKLTEFHLGAAARNEEGLFAVPKLVKLKNFIYPVVDVGIYKNHPCLENVGMAAGVRQDFEVFAGSRVREFTVCGDITEEQMQDLYQKMKQYVRIYSYSREFPHA